MTFTVTYRDKDGALREECVEAAGRTECVAALKARGIVPVSVREGVARPPRSCCKGEGALATSKRVAITAAVAIALAVGGVWWWMARGDGSGKSAASPKAVAREPGSGKSAASPKEARPEAADARQRVPPAQERVPDTRVSVPPVAEKPKERHDTVSIHTNNLGKVVEKWIGADGKLHMSVRYARKPVFDNASDDQLAMAVAGDGIQSIAPIPMVATSEQEFLESLKKPIVVNDDDPENVKKIKIAVREAREQMKQLIDNGMSYREALAEHQRLVNENVDTRNQCAAELKRLVDAGDREGAENYMKTMNAALEQMGIPALMMPLSREELNAERAKRRAEREAAKQVGK